MIDYRSVERLEVLREGEHVADLVRRPRGCFFRYTDAYLGSGRGPIALHLPVAPEGLSVEGVANLPSYFAGLLPEGVMFAAVRSSIGSAADDLFAVLAATGSDAIGDIDVRVPGENEVKPSVHLAEAARQIRSLFSGESEGGSRITAIPGVQPKLSLGALVRASRTNRYIAKFDSPDYPGLVINEFVFTRLARHCGLEVEETQIRSDALVLTRFDRIFDDSTEQIKKVHVEDALQVMDLFPNSKYSMEYVDVLEAIRSLGVSRASLLAALRLYVYSYIIGNGDLHAKNVSVIYDGQWRLSPCYDLLSTLPYRDLLPGAERMALPLVDEAVGRFSAKEFVEFGARFDLPEEAVRNMIDRVASLASRYAVATLQKYMAAFVVDTIIERAESLRGT